MSLGSNFIFLSHVCEQFPFTLIGPVSPQRECGQD